jgi:hypothetical protein
MWSSFYLDGDGKPDLAVAAGDETRKSKRHSV